MDIAIHLRERQEAYKRELAVKQAVLEMKKDNLSKAKEALASCTSERDKVKVEEQSVNARIQAKDRQIANVKKNIDEQTSLISSLQKELSGVFVFSFGKKKELKEMIAAAEIELAQKRSKLAQLNSDYSGLVRERKVALLESLENRLAEQERAVTTLEKEVSDSENEIEQINASIEEVDVEIQRKIDDEKKNAEEVKVAEATRLVQVLLAVEEKKKEMEAMVSDSRNVTENESDGTNVSERNHDGANKTTANERELREDLFQDISLSGSKKSETESSTTEVSKVSTVIEERLISATETSGFNTVQIADENDQIPDDQLGAETIHAFTADDNYTGVENTDQPDGTEVVVSECIQEEDSLENKDADITAEIARTKSDVVVSVNRKKNDDTEHVMLYYQVTNVDATGYEDESLGFVLKKGSRVCMQERVTSSMVTRRLRKEYAGVISDVGVLQEDIVLKSVSEATNFCAFGTASSTLMWKDQYGTTLRDLRKIEQGESVEEVERLAEETKKVEEASLAEGVQKAEKVRKTEEARKEEEIRKVEAECFAEETRKAIEAHLAEKAWKAEEARKAEEAQNAEEEQISFENNRDSKEQIFYADESLTPYFERYSVRTEDYSEIRVESLGFSVRLGNRLLHNGYKTVDMLLQANDSTLRQISGFGQGCLNELHNYLSTLSSSSVPSASNSNQNVEMTAELAPYKEQILYGDFSFLDGLEIGTKSEQIINKFKEAHSVLEFELVEEAINGAPEVIAIMEMLREFISYVEDSKKVDGIVRCIPVHRLEAKASWVIKCFTDSETALSILQSYIADNNQSLRDYLYANYEQIGANNQWFIKLVKWCQYNLSDDIKHFFVDQIKNERELRVINGRANRKTLEEVGKEENVTRERIRQIEVKVSRRFGIWQKRQRIMFKIFLDKGEETGLSSLEIIDCLGTYGKEFVYLMKGCETEEIKYDKQLDMFVIEDVSLTEKIQAYVEALPDAFPEKKLQGFLKEAEENDYPEKMVLAVIEDSYKKTGDTYHRFRLTLTTIYGDIMKKYYSEGIHVYDPDEIERFRKYVMEDYGLDISGKSDHAIGSILSRIGILCGRGIYKLRQEKNYISKDLGKRIHDYIEESSSPIFMTNTLFSIFEEDLLAEGIDNKYFLQGVLRDLYENEWIFRRDYISKDESYTSVYSSIVGFIRDSKYPVSKEDLNRKFPGVTEIVINLSVSDPNIINLFGAYIHSCRLKLSEFDIKYLKETVEDFLGDKEVCHCKEIYEYIDSDYPVLLTNNFVQYPFSLYSLLEYLFGDQYNFSRPYVARENAMIERALDVLKEIVKESDRMEISEIQAFAREHRATVYSIREFIDSCNETHLLISDLEVASIAYIGVTEEMASDLENRITMEINGTVPIHQLQCIHSLPKINVEWNAWLIYSVLNKWATKLEVGASASQFRQSYPVVAPIGKLNLSCIDETEGDHDGKIFVADDLSNIDELVSGFILDGLEDLDEL